MFFNPSHFQRRLTNGNKNFWGEAILLMRFSDSSDIRSSKLRELEREREMKVASVSESCFNFHTTLLHNPTTHLKTTTNFNPKSSSSKFSQTTKAEIEIRVCVNRTCRRQGSRETLETLSGISPPHITVISCGCLGRCGSGPNLVVLPQSVLVSHCGTATRAAQVLASFLGGNEDDPEKNLKALSLRKRAEEELEKMNFSEAEILLSQAIDFKPSGGVHLIYKSRSSARLAMCNNFGALEDAKEALMIAPQYPQAYICQGDVFLAMEEFDAAEKSYSSALQIDSSLRRSKSFKARVAKLQEKLTSADLPS